MKRAPLAHLVVVALSMPVSAQDAATVIARMKQTYSDMSSYRHSVGINYSEAVQGNKMQSGMDIKARLAKPNRALFEITGPNVGTFVAATDGKTQIIYRSDKNLYWRKSAPPTWRGFVEGLRKDGFVSEMDPIYFLMGAPQGMPGNLASKGRVNVNGKPCHLITGTYVSKGIAAGSTGKVSFWIDTQTNLIAKLQIDFRGTTRRITVTGIQNGKPVRVSRTLKTDRSITMLFREAVANPPLKDGDFAYAPPKDAVEQQLEKLLGR